jgi:hypothetical protein
MHEQVIKAIKALAAIGDPGETKSFILIAIIGFLMGGCQAVMARNEKTRWYDLLVAAMISSGSSFTVCAFAYRALGPDSIFVLLALAGPVGFAGVAIMGYLGGGVLREMRRRDFFHIENPDQQQS